MPIAASQSLLQNQIKSALSLDKAANKPPSGDSYSVCHSLGCPYGPTTFRAFPDPSGSSRLRWHSIRDPRGI
jgi:hypothetical protein